jgi:hypothetical protein
MIATSVVARSPTPLARLMPLVARLPGLVPNQCLVLGLSEAPDERIVAAYGPVQIRETQGGLSAQTRVKGEQDQALATALQRMRQFLCRNQRNGLDVRLQLLLVQLEEAPGRWVVRMGLIGPEPGLSRRHPAGAGSGASALHPKP